MGKARFSLIFGALCLKSWPVWPCIREAHRRRPSPYLMIGRRAAAARIATNLGNHSSPRISRMAAHAVAALRATASPFSTRPQREQRADRLHRPNTVQAIPVANRSAASRRLIVRFRGIAQRCPIMALTATDSARKMTRSTNFWSPMTVQTGTIVRIAPSTMRWPLARRAVAPTGFRQHNRVD